MVRVTGYGGSRGTAVSRAERNRRDVLGRRRESRSRFRRLARFIVRGEWAGAPWAFSVGADADRTREKRQGFVNNNGEQGALRRDEDDTVGRVATRRPSCRGRAAVAVAHRRRGTSRVKYDSDDHYVVASQSRRQRLARRLRQHEPVAGIVWHATSTSTCYASYGQGFETPTSRSSPTAPWVGLNFALSPATSSSTEWASRRSSPAAAGQLAAFARYDDEIIIDAAIRRTHDSRTPARPGAAGRAAVGRAWATACPSYAHYTYLRRRSTRIRAPARRRAVPSGRAPARQFPRPRLRRARMDRPAGRDSRRRWQRRVIRATALRQRAQHRRRAGLYGRQRSLRIRAALDPDHAEGIRAAQQRFRPPLRRLHDHRAMERPLLRTPRSSQLDGGHSSPKSGF